MMNKALNSVAKAGFDAQHAPGSAPPPQGPPSLAGSELRIPSVSLSLSSAGSSAPPGGVVVSSAPPGAAVGSPGINLRATPGRPGVHLVPVTSLSPHSLSVGGPGSLPSQASYYKPVTITPSPVSSSSSRVLSLGSGTSLSVSSSATPLRIPSATPKGALAPRTISLPYAPSPLPLSSSSSLPVARVVPQPCLGATTMTLLPAAMNLSAPNRPPDGEQPPARLISLSSSQQPAVSVTPVPGPHRIPPATVLEGPKPPPSSHSNSNSKAILTAAPSRPGILRRREGDALRGGGPSEGNSVAVAAALLLSTGETTLTTASSEPLQGPPDESSCGSTTLSATSSPGFPPINSSNSGGFVHSTLNNIEEAGPSCAKGGSNEASPRKKPRKQTFHINSSELLPQQSGGGGGGYSDDAASGVRRRRKPPAAAASVSMSAEGSLVVDEEESEDPSYSAGKKARLPSLYEGPPWPSRYNHFLRYSDVKVRPDRRPTVGELASHPWISQQVNGWKLYHLSSQMEDVGSSEDELRNVLLDLQRRLTSSAHADVNLGGVLENIKANLQRSQIVRDQVGESRDHLLAIFEHKPRILDIINKYVNKRTQKHREVSSS